MNQSTKLSMPTACGPTGLSPGGAGSTPRNHPDSLRQRGQTQLVSRPAGDPSLQHLAKAVPAERRRGLARLLCPVACVGSELGLRKRLEPGRGGGRAATQGVSLPSPPSWPWGLRRRYLGRGGEEGPPGLSAGWEHELCPELRPRLCPWSSARGTLPERLPTEAFACGFSSALLTPRKDLVCGMLRASGFGHYFMDSLQQL